MIEAGTALAVLQSALDRCRVDDIRTPEVYAALALLERHAAEKWPFNQFRSALDSLPKTPLEKEALADPQRLAQRHPKERQAVTLR